MGQCRPPLEPWRHDHLARRHASDCGACRQRWHRARGLCVEGADGIDRAIGLRICGMEKTAMKIVAYTALHYGADYLNHAIRSIIDDVDSYIVLYSSQGSHGHHSFETCPDSRADLYEIASNVAGDKLRWFDGVWTHEGQQRDSIFTIVPDADVIVVLDSDECYGEGVLQGAIVKGMAENVREVRIPLVHHWRSFYKGFTRDPAAPTRVHFPKVPSGITTFTPDNGHVLSHFGYAITPELMRYK